MNKSEMANWLQDKYNEWEQLLDDIGSEHLEQPGVNGGWSMKDVVAHLTGWNRWLLARLQAAGRGEPEPLPPWPAELESEDDINAWIYESYQRRPLKEIREETRQDFQNLFSAIKSLPEEARLETIRGSSGREYHLVWIGYQRFPAGEFFDHFEDDHLPDVHAWLRQEEKGS